MENPQALSQTIDASWQALLASLSRPYFYIEMSLIGASITLAVVVSFLLRRNLARQLERHPPRHFDAAMLMRPLQLLTPILAFFALSLVKPFAQRYADGSEWTTAFMQLTLAWLAARAVILIVKSRVVAYFISFVILIVTLLDVSGFMASTKAALDRVDFAFGKFRISMLNLAQGIIILVIVFWVANLLSQTLESYLRKSSRVSYNTRELIVKFFKIFVYMVAFLITLSAMGIDLTALAIFSGALGVGIGLGLQKITANFVSGITLLMEKSIKIGDLIEVSGMTGWVRQLNIRYALIESPDGRELLIPNEMLVSTQVTNWTHSNDQARVEFRVGVAYGSDVDLVRKIILEAVAQHPKCMTNPAPTCHLREFADSALVFVTTFWIADIRDGRFAQQSEVMMSILKKFAAAKIEMPFPQRVVHIQNPTPVTPA